jgi:capsular polysaccharide biosynthesis protein
MPLIIEPRRSWLIPQPLRILEESFPMVNDPWDAIKPRPSTWNYVLRGRKTLTLERAISVSYAWHNYYHFFVDALPQLLLLDSLGVSRDIPIVVPQQFATTRFVRDFQQLSTFFDGRTIVVQKPGEYIRVLDATYVAKDTFFSPAIFRILDSIHPVSPAAADPDRIYLRRDPTGPRALSNDLEIAGIAERHGYAVVDTATLSLREQITLFSKANTVVGIHGAGLTNIIFRRGSSLRLLEIAPADLGSTHYRSLCVQFGYEYERVAGGELDASRRFRLDPERFEQALRRLETGAVAQ